MSHRQGGTGELPEVAVASLRIPPASPLVVVVVVGAMVVPVVRLHRQTRRAPVIPLVLRFEELDYQLALEGWLPNALALNFSLASFSRLADFLPSPLLKLGKPPDLNQRRWLQALGVYPCASSYRPST